VLAPTEEGTASEDTAPVLQSSQADFQAVEKNSDLLLSIDFPEGEDLSLILAICYGFKKNHKANNYSLFQFNCYFFSWTVVSIAARRAAHWGKIAASKEQWLAVVQVSLNAITTDSPKRERSKRPESRFPSRRRIKDMITRKRKTFIPDQVPDDLAPVNELREALQSPLADIRYAAGNVLRNLLLRSQLGPVLTTLMRQQVQAALFEAKITAAERKATLIAMSEVSAGYSKPDEPTKYGELSWSDHCDVAWAVAKEASFAAALAASDKDTQMNAAWGDAWDTAWQEHWDGRIPANGNTPSTNTLGSTASRRAKRAWREEWDTISELGSQRASEMVEAATECLLAHLPDLDTTRLRIGEHASVSNSVKYCTNYGKYPIILA
jgi:hypothetical protein